MVELRPLTIWGSCRSAFRRHAERAQLWALRRLPVFRRMEQQLDVARLFIGSPRACCTLPELRRELQSFVAQRVPIWLQVETAVSFARDLGPGQLEIVIRHGGADGY